MGTVGDAYDNAMAESFFASLECELLDQTAFKTKTEARLAVFTYIEGWYNPRRRHSALDYRSPANFERDHRNTVPTRRPSSEPDLPTVVACETGAAPPVDKSAEVLTNNSLRLEAAPSRARPRSRLVLASRRAIV